MNTASITMDFSLHRNNRIKNKELFFWDALNDKFIPIPRSSFTAGTSPDCNVKLDHPGISGQHCKIFYDSEGFFVEDTGSKYGIFFKNRQYNHFNIKDGEIFFLANIPFAITEKPVTSSVDYIISRNAKILKLQEIIRNVCDKDMPVLINGESGTGKDLFSEYIHSVSRRQNGPFVSLNCGAIPPQLVESELFGHVKGSFSGASGGRDGVILKAHNGSLFLDEIGELRPDHQAALLRWIEKRTFRPVGSDKERTSNCNIISATHRNLLKDVESGRFRQDLYYRLTANIIEIPPLRRRPEDIPVLIDFFKAPPMNDKIFKNLLSWDWPGNVRELRAICMAAQVSGWEEAINTKLVLRENEFSFSYGENDEQWNQIQSTVLQTALIKHGGNIAKTARMLGLPRTTLIGKLKKFGLYQ